MQTRTFGAQSMVGPLKRALIHRPGPEFSDEGNFRAFGFTGELPDLAKAQAEHDAFAKALRDYGVEIEYLGEALPQCTGTTYVTDSAIVTDQGAILSRLGKVQRRGEETVVAKRLLSLGIPILYTIQAPGTLEGGGETIWLDHDTLLMGDTYRTNTAAYQQVKSLLGEKVDVIQFQLPHYKGPGTVLHLGSVMSMIDHNLCAAYLPLMPVAMVKLLQEREIETVSIEEDEFLHSASNILTVAPRKVIMLSGNGKIQRKLEEKGVEIKLFEGKYTGHARYAGPTCMTMSLLREY